MWWGARRGAGRFFSQLKHTHTHKQFKYKRATQVQWVQLLLKYQGCCLRVRRAMARIAHHVHLYIENKRSSLFIYTLTTIEFCNKSHRQAISQSSLLLLLDYLVIKCISVIKSNTFSAGCMLYVKRAILSSYAPA